MIISVGYRVKSSIATRFRIWATQKLKEYVVKGFILDDLMSGAAINQHLKTIFGDNGLQREATIKQYLIVQTEGSRQVQREVEHYSLYALGRIPS